MMAHHDLPPPYPPLPQHANSDLPQGHFVKIIFKVNKTYNLAVRDDYPVVSPADSEDPTQLWIKDCSYGERVRDNYGSPAFALVNGATKKILKHSKEKGHQVVLVDHRAGMLDEDVLWTESQDFGEGFRTIRMASDTLLNMTLLHQEEKKSLFRRSGEKLVPEIFRRSGEKVVPEINQGTPLVLDTWHRDDHQLWKIFAI